MHAPDRGVIGLGELRAARRGRPDWQPAAFGPRVRWYRTGRLALLAGLQAIGVAPGQRVWVPAYLCQAALAPLVQRGLEVVLYDITDTLQPSTGFPDVRPGDLVVLIHYFGLAAPAEPIRALCRERGARLIEDCAHGLPDPDSARPMGRSGDLAIFSLRKLLPVPDGAVLVVNDPAVPLPRSPSEGPPEALVPTVRLAQIVVESLAFRLGWNILPLEDRLRSRRRDGGGVGVETAPASGFSPRFLAALDLRALSRRRIVHYLALAGWLADVRGVEVPVPVPPEGSVPQVLPVRASNPARMCRALRGMGVGASQWPGADAVPNLALEAYPGARTWSERGLVLPVNESLQPRHLDGIARAVARAAAAS